MNETIPNGGSEASGENANPSAGNAWESLKEVPFKGVEQLRQLEQGLAEARNSGDEEEIRGYQEALNMSSLNIR